MGEVACRIDCLLLCRLCCLLLCWLHCRLLTCTRTGIIIEMGTQWLHGVRESHHSETVQCGSVHLATELIGFAKEICWTLVHFTGYVQLVSLALAMRQ